MDNNMDSLELDRLIDDYVSSGLDETGSVRLAELLDSQPAAREKLVTAVKWHQALATVSHQQCMAERIESELSAAQASSKVLSFPASMMAAASIAATLLVAFFVLRPQEISTTAPLVAQGAASDESGLVIELTNQPHQVKVVEAGSLMVSLAWNDRHAIAESTDGLTVSLPRESGQKRVYHDIAVNRTVSVVIR